MGSMNQRGFLRKFASSFVSGVLLFTQCLFAHQIETSFWSERRKTSAPKAPETLLARLPAAPPALAPRLSSFSAFSSRRLERLSSRVTGLSPLLKALPETYGSLREISVP